jgi:hypothetical protein
VFSDQNKSQGDSDAATNDSVSTEKSAAEIFVVQYLVALVIQSRAGPVDECTLKHGILLAAVVAGFILLHNCCTSESSQSGLYRGSYEFVAFNWMFYHWETTPFWCGADS